MAAGSAAGGGCSAALNAAAACDLVKLLAAVEGSNCASPAVTRRFGKTGLKPGNDKYPGRKWHPCYCTAEDEDSR